MENLVGFLSELNKTEWGENSHQNRSEVTELRYLGVNCQVEQHSRLRAVSLPCSSRDTPTLAKSDKQAFKREQKNCIYIRVVSSPSLYS